MIERRASLDRVADRPCCFVLCLCRVTSTTAPSGPQTFRRRIEHEFSRQLQFYSHTTARLAGQLAMAESQLDHANERRISESVHVMRQLNDLRHLNKNYKQEVLQVASELNAVKLKERLRRGKINAANEDRSNSPSRTREALHAPLDPNRHTQLQMSRMLARFVDPASRKSALAPKQPGNSTDDDAHADAGAGAASQHADESKSDWPEEGGNSAALHEQVSLMRQMKEESDAMLLNRSVIAAAEADAFVAVRRAGLMPSLLLSCVRSAIVASTSKRPRFRCCVKKMRRRPRSVSQQSL